MQRPSFGSMLQMPSAANGMMQMPSGASSLLQMPSGMMQMPSAAADPFNGGMLQQFGPPLYGPPTFVASQVSGPPPSSLFPQAADDDDSEEGPLLGPESGF